MAGQINPKAQTLTGPKTVTPKKTTPKKVAPKKAPTKAVAKVDKDKLPTDCTKAQATALTKKIRTGVEGTWKLMAQAAEQRAWKAMGYKNWSEWMDKEFGDMDANVQLRKDKRKEAVLELKSKGFSVRAIADITRATKSTVDRDIQEAEGPVPTIPNGTVTNPKPVLDIPPEDITEMPEGESEPAPQVNIDDRQIDTTNIGRKPVEVNVVSMARNIVGELNSVCIHLGALFSREDYDENKVAVQGTLETAVSDILDILVEEFADLVTERAPARESEPAV